MFHGLCWDSWLCSWLLESSLLLFGSILPSSSLLLQLLSFWNFSVVGVFAVASVSDIAGVLRTSLLLETLLTFPVVDCVLVLAGDHTVVGSPAISGFPSVGCWRSCCLKGQCHEIFCFLFFSRISFPQHQSITLGPFWIFSNIRGDICKPRCTTGINDTGG